MRNARGLFSAAGVFFLGLLVVLTLQNSPWFVTWKPAGAGEDGQWIFKPFDTTTGRQVFEDAAGGLFYTLPTAAGWRSVPIDDTAYGAVYDPGTPGEAVPASLLAGPAVKVSALLNAPAPFENVGTQWGVVGNDVRVVKPLAGNYNDSAVFDGALGTYGGAQSVTWSSPSGSAAVKALGPDGNFWAVLPADAMIGERDTADHTNALAAAVSQVVEFVSKAAAGAGIASGLASLSGVVSDWLAPAALDAAAPTVAPAAVSSVSPPVSVFDVITAAPAELPAAAVIDTAPASGLMLPAGDPSGLVPVPMLTPVNVAPVGPSPLVSLATQLRTGLNAIAAVLAPARAVSAASPPRPQASAPSGSGGSLFFFGECRAWA